MGFLDFLSAAAPFASEAVGQYRQGQREGFADRLAMEETRLKQMRDEEDRRARQERQRLEMQNLQSQIDTRGQPDALTARPQWSESRGGWVLPPDEANPMGRFVAPQGIEPRPQAQGLPYEERRENGGVAIYENGRFKSWKIRPPVERDAGNTPAAPVLTEGERKTGALLQTATEGYNTLETLLTGDNPSTPEVETGPAMRPPTLAQRARASLGMGVGNVLSPQQLRQMDQAAYSLAEAWLRLTSGGAITPQEIENVKMAIVPQPGDDDVTLANKARLRQTYISAIRVAAGRGASNTPASAPNRQPVTQRYNLEVPR